jgi:hypothetical protein
MIDPASAGRIAALKVMLLARDGKPGYKVNSAHIRAEIARLEAQAHGQADRSGS